MTSWCPQSGPQSDYCCCPLPEVFLGGARGGGKTDAVIGKWALKEKRYGQAFNAIMFRRTTVSAEDAVERSKQIYGPLGGTFNESKLRWRMPNGGRVAFAYLETIDDANAYQGRNITDAWVEESGQYPSAAPIDRLFGVLRSSSGVPIQLTLTANPGGSGQHWIRERYKLHPFPRYPKLLRRKLTDGSKHRVAVIPSRIHDNKILLTNDPGYMSRLHMVGSRQLVRAWLEGDWSAIEGAFFTEWSEDQHVIAPFDIPSHWLRFRSGDWGSASPFSVGWWTVCSDDFDGAAQGTIPRGALVRYREWYGAMSPGVGLKLTAEQVADGIISREQFDPKLAYGVLDPANFSDQPHQWGGGPSIAERINGKLIKAGLPAFHKADNTRVRRVVGDAAKSGPLGGWDALRSRLVGSAQRRDDGSIDWSSGRPMIYVFNTCIDLIRTLPVMQHDPVRMEDLDTNSEDHAVDDARYAVLSRPWIKVLPPPAFPKDGYSPKSEVVDAADSILLL